ncbi:MAG: polyisoprenoid-binding protein [candidate division Zixibacteria bacterium]|nr:polyisoprenoid-binding protein [candidate division Zixibacteria bacterium]
MLKRTMLAVALTLGAALTAHADPYVFDKAHSYVGFTIRHMTISRVNGAFNDYDGQIDYDPKEMSKSSVEITIKTASVDTRNSGRDDDLKRDGFFFVDSFPTITFKSTKVTPKDSTKFEITGDLTIRGITKPVTLQAEKLGQITDPRGGTKLGFTATTTINRLDFGVGNSSALPGGGLMLGRDVDISLEVEAGTPRPPENKTN